MEEQIRLEEQDTEVLYEYYNGHSYTPLGLEIAARALREIIRREEEC